MIIVWHYRDLRLKDNPTLDYAVKSGESVLPLYIHQKEISWCEGGASKWWLHHSLIDLKKHYCAAGSDLIIRSGDPKKILKELCHICDVKEICFNVRTQHELKVRDQQICDELEKLGVAISLFNGCYLIDPRSVLNQSNKPYSVFTPFSKAALKSLEIGEVIEAPKLKKCDLPPSETVDSLSLLPKKKWATDLSDYWKPGRESALFCLKQFCSGSIHDYQTMRDFMQMEKTSMLSPHIAFGEISPREIWKIATPYKGSEPFLRQLLWREFSNYFLYHFPDAADTSWSARFEKYPWIENQDHLERWQKGLTGYPIVDAAMRQLRQTGWMHNRTRMIVASFLVKDLMLHWIHGAKWFWDNLVDAELGNNTMGWQWTAGCGPDAAPYFRVFNPILQSRKFDKEGQYIRRFVPELVRLPTKWIHAPCEAPDEVLEKAGVILGQTYPKPIVNHSVARKQALAAFEGIK